MIAYLHPDIKLTRTLTGRLATSGFPILGLPKHTEQGREIRGLVRAPEGYSIYEADYSQIELRVAAYLAQDEQMLEAYRKGEDIHAKTAHEVLGAPKEKERQDKHKHRLPAKTANFSMLMGTSEKGLTESVHKAGNLEWSKGCPGCKSFKALHDGRCDSTPFIAGWFRVYSGIKRFMDERRSYALEHGRAYGLWGMDWYLPGAWSPNEDVRESTLRQSHALPVQEGAQRLLKLAMAKVHTEDLPWAEKILGPKKVMPMLQYHDALSFVVRTEAVQVWHERVKATMEGLVEWNLPIIAEGSYGQTWLDQIDIEE